MNTFFRKKTNKKNKKQKTYVIEASIRKNHKIINLEDLNFLWMTKFWV